MARRRAARGTQDLLPDRVPVYDWLFGTAREVFRRSGYGEIRTPLFEDTTLFARSLGEVTDVVEKEMFTVERGGTSVTFRPEGTASVVRAYLEHNLDKSRAFQKLYYVGPMFRFERPQAGRERQFYQLGAEALGSSSPLLDAEIMQLAMTLLDAVGLQNLELRINSIGGPEDRDRYRGVLKAYMTGVLEPRCDDCQLRIERNVFRMLDCKVRECQPSNTAAPHFLDSLTDESRARFEATCQALDALEVPYRIDHGIVRGFDYYTHTVFELHCTDLGARSAVCGGGRYDHLIHDLGGPDLGCVGFAIGVSPTMLALEQQNHPMVAPREPALDVFVAPVADEQRLPALVLLDRVRRGGIQADTDYENKSLKAMLKAANKRGARIVLMIGAHEVSQGTVTMKDFGTGEEQSLPADDQLIEAIRQRLNDKS